MAGIYSNSNVCIAASMSAAGDGGCFRHKPVRTEIFRSADCPRVPGAPEWEIRARHHFNHVALSDATLSAQPNWVSSGRAPLLSGGWVFQERLLSPRFLYFLDQELFMECREMEACKCHCQRSRMGGSGPRKVEISKELATGTPDSIAGLWHRLVMTYSGLCLTYDTDRLPAFLGLARYFAQYRPGSYLHGIWSDSIQVDLGWATWNPGGIVFISRPEKQSPPTWSWAAVNAKIMYPPVAWKQTETHCEILSLGALALVLSGLLVEATIEYEGRGTFVYLAHSDLKRHTSFSNNYSFDCSGPGHVTPGASVFCFKLYSGLSGSTIFTYSLVLRKAGPTYERIGLLQQSMKPDKAGKTKSIYDLANGLVAVKLI